MQKACQPDMQRRVIRISAPGKVILHGEHSVVYGKTAIAASLDLTTTLVLTSGGDHVTLRLPDVGVNESWPLAEVEKMHEELELYSGGKPSALSETQASRMRRLLGLNDDESGTKTLALLSFFHLYLSILPVPQPLSVHVVSQMPTGAGLGSSAAYAVCLAGALLKLPDRSGMTSVLEEDFEAEASQWQKIVCEWAFTSEKIMHGSPSGIDNSICAFGGAISFRSGRIEPLAIPPMHILLVNTRVSRNTKSLVARVAERKQRFPGVIEPLIESMDGVAQEALGLLQDLNKGLNTKDSEEAYRSLCCLVDVNHGLLSALGVSHPSLEQMVHVAHEHGLYAKLTGAGGGGFGIVVVPPDADADAVVACRSHLEELGYHVWNTQLGGPGVVVHKTQASRER